MPGGARGAAVQVMQTIMATEQTLSIIKPDAISRNLVGNILARLESEGLLPVAARMLRLDRARAEQFYGVHRQKPFFEELVEFMSSGPILAQVLEGEDAISRYRQLMGATFPSQAKQGTLRGDFREHEDVDPLYNIVHGSDSPETARTEIDFFFSPAEIHSRAD